MASLVNHSVNNLINGVSQQATSVRLDNQFEEQINCFSDVTKGLTIRNGLELMNVIDSDISNRHKIEFTIDDTKYLLGLDADNVTPLLHIPLTADVNALSASLTSPEYFKNTTQKDIRVIEDKDRVYVLNKKQVAGLSKLRKSFYDIRVLNDRTGITDTEWDSGTYTLTIDAVADPETTATVTSGTVNIVVDHTMTTVDIANAINAESALIAETGECYIVGDIGSYRLHFDSIPKNFTAPTVSIAETTTIQGTNSVLEDKITWRYDADNDVTQRSVDNKNYFDWDGVDVGSTTSNTLKVGDTTYYRGVYKGLQASSFAGNFYYYEIGRRGLQNITDDYTLEIVSSGVLSSQDITADKFADKGMIWVTGVASNQEYNVTIKYEDAAGTPQADIVLSTIGVSTAVSQIKLNWVAGQIQSQIDGQANFTAVQYDNAVYFFSTTPQAYTITSIETTNNFDNFSLNSVINATITNGSAIQDTSNLPPIFKQGFKLRVGDLATEGSNYYLKYDEEFKGWKESGLDESRVVDNKTLPYYIDKNEVRKTGTIELKPITWETANAGDEESNPYPSFIDRTINDIFFYGSRLGFATDDTIVMSRINAPTTFFRTTTATVVANDRVDIKLDNSKLGYATIKDVMTANGKLIVNTGSTQAVLKVNTSFELDSARLETVSSFSLGNNKPLPVNNGIYFGVSIDNYTNIYNYVPVNDVYDAQNITKHIPRYIEGNLKLMGYAEDFAAVSVEEDLRTLYVQNRYSEGQQVLQNAWHKWTLPYDLEYFYFDDNTLYVLMTAVDSLAATKTIVCKYDLTPQVVTESADDAFIGWIPYVDCWTKDKTLIENFSEFIGINDQTGALFSSVTEAYDSSYYTQIDEGAVSGPFFDLSSPAYYWNVTGDTIELVWNDGTPISSGNGQNLTELDFGGFRYFRGDLQDANGNYEVSRCAITTTNFYADEIVYGVPFTLTLELSEIIPRQQAQDGFTVMNFAQLMLRRMRLFMNKTSKFRVDIAFQDRAGYVVSYTGETLGKLQVGRNNASDVNFNFPINGKSDKVRITITSDSSTPFNLLSAEWQGQLIMRGRNI